MSNARTVTYDAAGGLVREVDTGSSSTITYTAAHDGDGQVVYETKQTTGTGPAFVALYILRATALGGEPLTTLTATGAKDVTYVPAQGLIFARQMTVGGPFLGSTVRNPVGLTESNKGIYDPLGNYIPFQQPPDPRPAPGQYSSASMAGLGVSLTDPYNYGFGCVLDGVPTSCSRALGMLNNGNAVPCPGNDCGPRMVNGRLRPFHPNMATFESHGVGIFSVSYNWGKDLGYLPPEEGWERLGTVSNSSTSLFFLPVSAYVANPQDSEQARKDREKKLTEGLNIAKKLLESHPACQEYLSSIFASATSQLNNATFSYGGHSDDTIAQAWLGGPIKWSSVTLYDHFYSNTVGHYTGHFDLTPAMARAFVLLHETSHNTGQILHVPGVKAWSQEELDKNIYELCGFAKGGSW